MHPSPVLTQSCVPPPLVPSSASVPPIEVTPVKNIDTFVTGMVPPYICPPCLPFKLMLASGHVSYVGGGDKVLLVVKNTESLVVVICYGCGWLYVVVVILDRVICTRWLLRPVLTLDPLSPPACIICSCHLLPMLAIQQPTVCMTCK